MLVVGKCLVLNLICLGVDIQKNVQMACLFLGLRGALA